MLVNVTLLIGISAAWAAGYLLIGDARQTAPVSATAVMTLYAALVIVPGVRLGFRRALLPTLRQRPWVPMVMGLSAIAVPNLAVVAAEHSVTPELAAVLGTSVPIATILLTTFVTREVQVSLVRMAGVVVAVTGLVVFVGWGNLLGGAAPLGGMLIMMSGGLVFAFNGLLAAHQTRDLDPAVLAAWTILFGAVYLLAAALAFERPDLLAIDASLPPLIAEGVIGMGLAYLGYYLLVARAGAAFASLYAFLVPVLGIVAVAVLYDSPLTAQHATGVGIVLAGLFLLTRNDTVERLIASVAGRHEDSGQA